MVPSYKKLPDKALSVQQEWCNAKIAKLQIKSEHYIGLIKGKFQYFKCICVQIHEKKDMRWIIHLFTCAVILHNLVVRDPVPADWELRSEEDNLDEDDALNLSLDGMPDNTRHNWVMAYLLEKHGLQMISL